jgi:hypothetical protein
MLLQAWPISQCGAKTPAIAGSAHEMTIGTAGDL